MLSVERLEDRMMLNGDVGDVVFEASFEDAAVAPGDFAFVSSVSGLTATGSPVEIQNNHPSVGPASQGQKHLELDGRNGVYVDLDFSGSNRLKLFFDYSARPGVSAEQNAISIIWNDVVIDTAQLDGQRNRSTSFRTLEYDLNGGTGRLEFRSTIPGETLGLGGLLDNIRIVRPAVPLELAEIPDQTIAVDEQLNITASLLPPNEDLIGVNYRLVDGPPGLQINSTTGNIQWTASQENVDLADMQNDSIVLGSSMLLFRAGFEDVNIESGGYGFVQSVSGFGATGPRVELQHNHPSVGPASQGNQHLELDKLNGIGRDVATVAGDQYELVFDYSPRPGVGTIGNTIEIWWDGQRIDSITKNGTNRSTSFEEYRFDVSTFSGDLTRLEFRSNDPEDQFGLGGLLDNIRLYRRPVTIIDGPNGKYEVVVEVTGPNGQRDRESFTICLEDVPSNLPPTIDAISDQSVTEGEVFSLDVNASDPEQETLVFSFDPQVEHPATAFIDPTTGSIQWTPSEDDGPGVYEFAVTTTDPSGQSDTEEFSLTVIEFNQPPTIDSIADQNVVVGELLTLFATATDTDRPANQLAYSLAQGAPSGASIDSMTGEFSWTPASNDNNTVFPISVVVSDDAGGTDSTSFNIVVGNINQPPTLIVPEEIASGEQVIDVSSSLTLDFDAVDPDADVLLFSLEEPSLHAQIDPDTGVFTLFPTAAQIDQTMNFTVVVRDSGSPSLTDRYAFAITVESCPFPDDLSGWRVDEHGGSETGMGHVTAEDCIATLSEGDSFQVTLEQSFVIQQNKAIEFTFSDPNFDTSATGFINDAFEVALLDASGNSLIETFEFGRDAFLNISEGLPIAVANGVQVNGNTITVGLNGLPVGDEARLVFRLLNDDADTQTEVLITDFQLVDSFIAATPKSSVLFEATTTESIRTQMTTSVEADNSLDLPVVVSAGQIEPTTTGTLGEPVIVARAPRGGAPAGSRIVVTGNAIAQGTQSSGDPNQILSVTVNGVPVDQLDPNGNFFTAIDLLPGNNELVFEAIDIASQTTQATLTIVGTQFDSEINFNQFADITQTVEGIYSRTSFEEKGNTLFVDLVASNPGSFAADGPLLVGVTNVSQSNVSLLNIDGVTPDGMPYYDLTALLDQDSLQPGEQTDIATIEFFNPSQVQFTYDLIFLAQTNSPPEITSIPVVEAYYDDPYIYDVDAVDANEDLLSFELTIASDGMTIDAATGLIDWSPTINDYGLHDIAVEVTDGRGGRAEQRFTINVTEAPPNRPPIIVSPPITSASVPVGGGEAPQVDLTELVLNGDAAVATTQDGTVLRLAPAIEDQVGTAFTRDPQNASEFSAAFSFRISESEGRFNPVGSDGIAFVIQTDRTEIPNVGGTIGYGGINNVAVEFDTWQNSGADFSSNHAAISIQGDIRHEQGSGFVVDVSPNFDNGELWYAWVDYDGTNLEVRLNQTDLRPSAVLLTRELDIPELVFGETAFFGFTSATGGNWSHHDLVDWQFRDQYAPIGFNSIGDFVVDWQSETINISNSNEPSRIPTIAVDQNGDLHIAYAEGPDRGAGWYENLVYAKYQVNGSELTAPVSIDTPGWNGAASLVFDDDNRPVVAWNSINTVPGEEVFLTTLDEQGVASGFVQVSDTPSRVNSDLPHLAAGNEGELFVIWQDEVNDPIDGDNNRRRDLFLQKLTFAETGYVLDGDPVEITTSEGTGFANVGYVNNFGGTAVDGSNQLHVVWSDWRDSSDFNQTEIFYEILSSDGMTVVDEMRISTLDSTPATRPQIVIDSNNNAHVLWIERTTERDSLVHAIIDPLGNVLSTNRLLAGQPDAVSSFSMTMDEFDQLHVLQVDSTGEQDVVYYQRFNREGDPLVKNLQITETDAAVQLNATYPAIAISGKDTFSVVWEETTNAGTEQETSDAFFKSFTVRSTSIVTYRYDVQALDPDNDHVVFELTTAPEGMTINPDSGVILWSPSTIQLGDHEVVVLVDDGRGGLAEQSFLVCVHQDLSGQTRQVTTVFESEFETRLVNDAPTIVSTPSLYATQGEAYEYDAVANDLNNDTLQWNLDSAPIGMTIDADTGKIQWTPSETQLGVYRVVISAWDSVGAHSTQRFEIEVSCHNLAPAILSIPPTAALTQRQYTYAAKALDREGDPLSWSLEQAPDGMSIHPERGIIQWQPTVEQIGLHDVIISVSDGSNTAKQFYTVVVTSADDLIDPNDPSRGPKGNRAPRITSTPSLGATVDQLYLYQIEALDLDGHDLSYRLVGTAPQNMSVDSEGELTWTPAPGVTGDVAVNIQVVDEFGAIASQGFVIKVESNSAPTINSTPPTTIVQGKTYRYSIDANDADNDPLSFSLIDSPEGMQIDPQNGLLIWSTNRSDVAVGDRFRVEALVVDTFGYQVKQPWQVEILADTIAPVPSITVLSPEGVFFGDRATFNIGSPYRVQVLARDNAVVSEIRLTLDGVDVPLDDRGIATITPVQSGEFELIATATDTAGLTGTDQVTVELLNSPPEIISKAPRFGAANEDFRHIVVATDAEGHSISYSLTSGPAAASINSLSGELTISGTAFDPGTYEIVVRATDSFGAFTEETLSFDAIDLTINHAPIFLTEPPTEIPAGLYYYYLPETLDYNGDTVTYSLSSGGNDFVETTGRLRFRAPFTPQTLEFEIQASDGNGGVSTQAFTVNVTEPNRAPIFISEPTVRVQAGQRYVYAPVISDPNGDSFVLYNLDGPRERKAGDFFSSWSIDIGDDNVLRWQTDLNDVGSHYIKIGAQDQWSEWGYQSFILDVVEDLTSPVVEILATPNPAEVGDLIDIQVIAEDDGVVESLSFTFDGELVPLDEDGRAMITANATGNFELTAIATDDDGNTTTRAVPLQVRDLSDRDAPVVSLSSPANGTEITAFTDIVGSVTDANLDFYSLSYRPVSGGTFVEFLRSDQTIEDGVLGTFDPSTLANDAYVIRLYARDVNGQDAFTDTTVDVMGELKLGNFALSFTDMTIPVGGIPVVVGRTYDSLNANRVGEFGYGWRLEYRDVDLRTSVAPSGTEDLGFYRPFKDGSRVYLTLPGGKREGFTFEVKRAGGLRGALGIHYGEFVPDAGVKTQLAVQQFELAFDSEANVYTWGSNQAYNPSNSIFGGKYYATREDGMLFEIDGDTGDLERVIDANGNTVTFSDTEIVSSSGQRVEFVRDAQGRIIQAIDPEGNAIVYRYDDQGNLISVTDREDNVTQFRYDSPRPHYLSEVIDPLGRTGIRTEYDETGKLVKLIDVSGNVTQIIHDPDNFVEQIVDPLGNTTTLEYDQRGNVLREIDAFGNSTSYTYDIENNELTITDALGNTTEMTYSGQGDLLTTTDPLGNITTRTYDRLQPSVSLGNGLSFAGFVKPFSVETSSTNAIGDVTQMQYDSQGNLVAMVNAAGETNTFSLDERGLAVAVSRAGTTPQSFQYDAAGFLVESIDAMGNRTEIAYNGNGEIASETTYWTQTDGSIRQLTRQNEYDREGRLIVTRTFEDGELLTESESRYNELGQLIEQIDPLNRSTRYVYDERGLLVETIYPDATPDDDTDNPRTQTEYDLLGRRVAQIDELGARTEFVYDALGRLVVTVFPDNAPNDSSDNPRTETVYDALGRTIARIDERGHRSETVFDAAGNAVMTILPDDTPDDSSDNPRIKSVFNAAGQQIEQIDPLGNKTRYEYEDGRVVRTIFADGTSSESVYNDRGLVVASIDQNGIRTDYEHDDQGQLVAVIAAEVTNPLNGLLERPRTEYEYDDRGNLLTQRDAQGKETTYEYDGQNRRIRTTLPMGQSTTSSYDSIGRLVETTDFEGQSTRYVYDARDRLVRKTFVDGSFVETNYTATGLVESIVDSRGTTTYEYDERGRLLSHINPDSTSLSYTYDATGNRTSITVPSGTTNYTFDARSRVRSVTDPDGDVTTYTYNAINLIQTTHANGTREARVYDALNRLTYLENSGTNGIINSFSYGLDAAGNRIGVLEDNGRRVNYQYDNLYRLTRENIVDSVNGDRSIDYTYDQVGNRLQRMDSVDGLTTYSYDLNDRLLTENNDSAVTEYAYDHNGNTLTASTDGELSSSYVWDVENRLIAVDTDGDGVIDVTNEYDAAGVRIAQEIDGSRTRFLIDSAVRFPHVIEEYTEGGVIKVSYVYGRDLISQNRPGQSDKSIYHTDGLGSTRVLTNSSGVVTDRYDYDAFGRILNQTGNTENLYLFAGEQRDFATGFDYLRARFLNPVTGRFMSRDPAPSRPDMPLTANRYSYVENNPLNLIDPSGLSSIAEVSTTQAIVGSLIASQGFLASILLFESALSNDIVKSKFLTLSISTATLFGTVFLAKTEPLPGYPEGLLQGGIMIGTGASARPTSVGFEFSSGTTYSPGLFFDSANVAKAAFMPIFSIFSAGISIGPLNAGFGGGFIGFSAVDLSGFGVSPSVDDLDGNASVFAGVSIGGNGRDCRNHPTLCSLADIDLGGPGNEDLLRLIFRLTVGL